MNPDDPRSVRTDDALSSAIRRLAADKPVEELTVNEVCAASGISRATFYRRARTPGELLSAELEQVLHTGFAEFTGRQPSVHGSELLAEHRRMLDWLTGHLEQFERLYQHSFSVDHSALALTLRNRMMQWIRDFLDSRRDEIVLPAALLAQSWPVTREILSCNYVDGEIGMIRVWLGLPDGQRDRSTLAEWMLALTPAWNRRLMDMGGGRV